MHLLPLVINKKAMQFIITMLRNGICLLVFLCMGQVNGFTQKSTDTIWVFYEGKQAYVRHTVESGETLFMLANRFGAPAAATARLNEVSYADGLAEGSIFKIPIGKFNYYSINSVVNSRPIYYRVQEGDRLRTVSRLFNVAQSAIQRWNNLPLPEIFSGQALQVGWIKFDEGQQPFAEAKEREAMAKAQAEAAKDSATKKGEGKVAEEEADLSKQFYENNQGKELQETSGAAVFFKSQISGGATVHYAFFDDAPRGTILSIYNPSTKKAVYAKVIGPIPQISMYHNARLGLSLDAAKELQANSQRIFVKIKY